MFDAASATTAGGALAGSADSGTAAEATSAPAVPERAAWISRWPRLPVQFRAVAPALIGYAALRIVCMVVVWIWASRINSDFAQIFARWDMKAYADIARFGYDQTITYKANGVPHPSNLAYFPLYPLMIRGLVTVLPISYVAAGLAIDWVASLAAVWGMFMLGKHLYGRRVGIALGIVWAVVPYAFDETINLTESLFTALAVWCLYALLTRRWLTAGVLCLIAGFSRPTAVALIAAVGVAAVVALIRREGAWWRPVLAVAISPLAWLGYLVWVAERLHRADAWFYVESVTFRSPFDGGRYTVRRVVDTLAQPQQTVEPYVVTLVLLAALVLLVLSIVQRQPLPLVVYSALLLLTTVAGANYFHTNPRHLLPAVPLLLPFARAVVRMRLSSAVAVVGVMAAIAAWYGGYLALIWGHSY